MKKRRSGFGKYDAAGSSADGGWREVLFADLTKTLAAPLLEKVGYPWELLADLSDFIAVLGASLPAEEYETAGDGIYISKSAAVSPSAEIMPPCIIGHGAAVGHCAFIRGSVIMGEGAAAGNSTELKNCVLFDGVKLPHFNYAGDSVFGFGAHMGAGAVTSNVKCDRGRIRVHLGSGSIVTERQKLGAMVGDFCEIGCGAVLNPGSVIGRCSTVYPLSSVRGFVPPCSICKGASSGKRMNCLKKYNSAAGDGKGKCVL